MSAAASPTLVESHRLPKQLCMQLPVKVHDDADDADDCELRRWIVMDCLREDAHLSDAVRYLYTLGLILFSDTSILGRDGPNHCGFATTMDPTAGPFFVRLSAPTR